jgi:hypothetical protein
MMSSNSMEILIQRYFDNDLSAEEKEAFLYDVATNPGLAAQVRLEAQLEMAIVDDAFSIEPPAALRAAVLEHILASSDKAIRVVPRLRPALIALLLLLTLQPVEKIANHGKLVQTSERALRSATNSYAEVPTIEVPKQNNRTVPKRTNQQVDAQRDYINVDASSIEELAPVAMACAPKLLPANAGTIVIPPLASQVGTVQLPSTANTFLGIRSVVGIVSSSSQALRLQFDADYPVSAFVEVGRTTKGQSTQMFRDGNVLSTQLQLNGGYLAIGGTYAVPLSTIIPELGLRRVTASAGVGAGTIGVIAVADASIEFYNEYGIQLEGGFRWMYHVSTVGNVLSATSLINPMVKVSMAL